MSRKLYQATSKTYELRWEEAMEYLANHQRGFILAIKGMWARRPEPMYHCDLSHLWDLKKNREAAREFLSQNLGLSDYYIIEH